MMTVAAGDRIDAARTARRAPEPSVLDIAYQRDLLLRVGPTLADYLEPSVSRLVRDLVEKIRQRPFRLAVIGQMKAGKSSLVNALARRPGLVPTDVNPWTAVVTQLHFGHPSGQTDGAVFRFFSEAEWDHLAAGGDLRVHQERLVPDLDLDAFRAQIDAVRGRAAERLGADYTALLGSEHRHDRCSPELLSSYVADHDGSATPEKIYSDITRTAEVFLSREPFDIPLTLVDTPGTNDPFLVRDEITLRCLDEMDAAIVVLSARQALSAADLALIRTMRGLRKDRLLVVVNRCDELEDPFHHRQVIAAHVARLLEREFGQEIPVLTCSAHWANAAHGAVPAELDLILTDELTRYVTATGLATRDEVASWRTISSPAARERMSQVLLAASGFPAVTDALADLVVNSGLGQSLRQAVTTLITISEQQESLARRDLQQLEEVVKGSHTEVLSGGFERERLETAIQRLDGTMAKLERIAAERTAEIEATQRMGLDRLRERLLHVAGTCIEAERPAIMFSLDQQTPSKPVRFDVAKIRKALEQAFLSEYRALYQHIVNIQLAASQHFRRVVNDELPSTNMDVHVNVISNSFPYPSLRALSRISAFDVDPKLWTRWRRSKKTLREAVEAFEQILRSEFDAIAHELARVAEHEILGSASSLQRRLNLTIMDAVNSARQRRQDLLSSLEAVQHQRQPLLQERLLEEQLDRLTEARERLRMVDGLARSLKAAAPRYQDDPAQVTAG